MSRVLLVSADLLARARLENAARVVGAELDAVGPDALVEALRERNPDVVVLDLDAGGAALLDRLGAARAEGTVPDRVIGYFSHVDDALGRAAELAGVQALPRGRFWRTATELLQD